MRFLTIIRLHQGNIFQVSEANGGAMIVCMWAADCLADEKCMNQK